jgi:alkylation response protein AidB-like acyl-CoA dehydrogenase
VERAVEARVESLICYRVVSMQDRGEIPNREASIAKLYSSELDVRLASTAMHLAGLAGQVVDDDFEDSDGGRYPRFYMHSTTSPIGGGTSEVQRDIIAGRGLGMPRG